MELFLSLNAASEATAINYATFTQEYEQRYHFSFEVLIKDQRYLALPPSALLNLQFIQLTSQSNLYSRKDCYFYTTRHALSEVDRAILNCRKEEEPSKSKFLVSLPTFWLLFLSLPIMLQNDY